MASLVVSVSEFKSKCAAILENVSAEGDLITVTKHGKPVGTVRVARAEPLKRVIPGKQTPRP